MSGWDFIRLRGVLMLMRVRAAALASLLAIMPAFGSQGIGSVAERQIHPDVLLFSADHQSAAAPAPEGLVRADRIVTESVLR